MHLLPLPLAFLLLLLLPNISSAPADPTLAELLATSSVSSTQDVDDASTSSSHSTSADTSAEPTSTHLTKPTTTAHKPTVGTSKNRPVTQTTKAAQITVRPGNTIASPTRTDSPVPSRTHTHPPHSRSQPVAALILEILGALAGCAFLISVLRCIYSYNRTPARDRISAILHRHQLQREMEELERNPPDPRRSLVEPPPPYLAPPPQYDPGEESPLSSRHNASYSQDTHGQLAPLRPNG